MYLYLALYFLAYRFTEDVQYDCLAVQTKTETDQANQTTFERGELSFYPIKHPSPPFNPFFAKIDDVFNVLVPCLFETLTVCDALKLGSLSKKFRCALDTFIRQMSDNNIYSIALLTALPSVVKLLSLKEALECMNACMMISDSHPNPRDKPSIIKNDRVLNRFVHWPYDVDCFDALIRGLTFYRETVKNGWQCFRVNVSHRRSSYFEERINCILAQETQNTKAVYYVISNIGPESLALNAVASDKLTECVSRLIFEEQEVPLRKLGQMIPNIIDTLGLGDKYTTMLARLFVLGKSPKYKGFTYYFTEVMPELWRKDVITKADLIQRSMPSMEPWRNHFPAVSLVSKYTKKFDASHATTTFFSESNLLRKCIKKLDASNITTTATQNPKRLKHS
jgi:hypothetical protein